MEEQTSSRDTGGHPLPCTCPSYPLLLQPGSTLPRKGHLSLSPVNLLLYWEDGYSQQVQGGLPCLLVGRFQDLEHEVLRALVGCHQNFGRAKHAIIINVPCNVLYSTLKAFVYIISFDPHNQWSLNWGTCITPESPKTLQEELCLDGFEGINFYRSAFLSYN